VRLSGPSYRRILRHAQIDVTMNVCTEVSDGKRSRRSSGSGDSLARRRCCITGLHAEQNATSRVGEWPVTWVGVAGFEPAASSSRTERAARQVRWSATFRHVRGIQPGHDGCV
jgi:hypothetical protein